jgi:hypothetical protein
MWRSWELQFVRTEKDEERVRLLVPALLAYWRSWELQFVRNEGDEERVRLLAWRSCPAFFFLLSWWRSLWS